MPEVAWLRPKDFADVTNPSLFKNGIESDDAIGLKAGNVDTHMWFVSCAAIVAGHAPSLKDLFVSDKYCAKGIYVLKFYKDTTWRYVLVDDRIPCDAATKRPLFAGCSDPNEFWINILMKAYAKLHGCYEALTTGQLRYGLRDMTGEVAFDLSLPELKDEMENGEMWQELSDSMNSPSPCLLGCQIKGESAEAAQCGLTANVSYSILKISDAITGKWLLHLHNPWGGMEWNGKWSDEWDGWTKTPIYKEKLHYKAADDGTFWMDAVDFAKYFTKLYACPIFPDTWPQIRFRHAEWKGETAGGYQAATWGNNPSFKITVNTRTHGIITLSQPDARFTEDYRSGKRKWNEYPHQIGMIIYKTNTASRRPQGKIAASWFGASDMEYIVNEAVQSSLFVNKRSTSIILEYPLEPGEVYYVVPCTTEPNQESVFYLTMASEQMVSISGYTEETDMQVKEIQGKGMSWFRGDVPVSTRKQCNFKTVALLVSQTEKPHSLHDAEDAAAKISTFDHLWCDPDFPADYRSLYYDMKDKPKGSLEPHQVAWKRPSQIAKKPYLVNDDEIGEIVQGLLQDSWLLSCAAMLRPEMLRKLFVSIEFASLGIYVVQFWKNGEWVPVLVDDRIPCNVQTGVPLYARCRNPNEIWILILEKAYAKLHGCYEAITKGTLEYGLKDLSGCMPMCVGKVDPDIWRKTITSVQSGHELFFGLNSSRPPSMDDVAGNVGLGILANHGYTITSMQFVGAELLFRVRNPWGRLEWTGKWSDEWSGWTKTLKEQLGWADEDDGKFWMAYDDLKCYFTEMYICDTLPRSWSRICMAGSWRGKTAGGSSGFGQTWKNNPCYKFTVETPTNVRISVSQRDGRMKIEKWMETDGMMGTRNWNKKERPDGKKNRVPIGFVIYKRVGNDRPWKLLSSNNENDIVGHAIFSDARDVTCEVQDKLVPFIDGKPVTYFIVSGLQSET